ncbi:MAG: hypothetical protein JRJ85_13890 [Deltaproteobacteria bacterium]|nr:hypothetical protein [Deltaproteobacteria bacterium]
MIDLIVKTIRLILPEFDGIEIFNAYRGREGRSSPLTGLEEVKQERAKGNPKRAVLIYGFDSEENIRQHQDIAILDAPGVFYLRLPALVSDIKKVLKKAINTQIPDDNAIDEKSFRDYAIREIRAFKHSCDNLWMSMSSSAHRAEKAIEKDKTIAPVALKQLKLEFVESLSEKYRELEPMIIRLGIKNANEIGRLFEDASEAVRKIEDGKTVLREAVDLAFAAFQKIKKASELLSRIKELNQHDQTGSFH